MNVITEWVVLGLVAIAGSAFAFKMLSTVFALGFSTLTAALHVHGAH